MIPLATALTRLGLALLFGGVIGIEREWRHKNAGIKTNTLVALGAATFAMISNTFGPTNHNPAQIAAAVVTGIGFIGAGVIIHRGATVQGVTTAATLFANSSVGVAVGLGQIYVGAVIFFAIIFVQFTMRKIGFWVDRVRSRASRVELHVDCENETLPSINEAWARFEREIQATVLRRRLSHSASMSSWRVTFVVTAKQPLDISKFEQEVASMRGVKHVEARFAGWQEEPDQVM